MKVNFVLTSEKVPDGFCFVWLAFQHLQQIPDHYIAFTVLPLCFTVFLDVPNLQWGSG